MNRKRILISGLVLVLLLVVSYVAVTMGPFNIGEQNSSGSLSEIGIDYSIEETGPNQYVISLSEEVDEMRFYSDDSEVVSRSDSSSVQLNIGSEVDFRVFEDGEEYKVQTIG